MGNAEGGNEILRIVRLIYNPHKLIPLPATTTSVKSNKKQTFLCVSAIVEATEPKYILIEGKHGKDQHSEHNFVSKDKNYKCKECCFVRALCVCVLCVLCVCVRLCLVVGVCVFVFAN